LCVCLAPGLKRPGVTARKEFMSPSLPTYTSKRNIESKLQAPIRNEVDQAAQANQNLLNTVNQIAQDWSNANDVMQVNKTSAEVSTHIARVKQQALEDQNPDNVEKYLKELNKAEKLSPTQIKNAQVRENVALHFKKDLAIAKIEIEGIFKQKQHFKAYQNLEETVRNMSLEKSNAPKISVRQDIDKKMGQLIEANVVSGVITEAGGRKLLDDYRLGSVDLDIMQDQALEQENSWVYSQLQAGKDGEYAHLTDAERAERLEKTKLHIRRNRILNDHTVNLNQDQNETDLLLNFGTVTQTKVKDLLISTGIRKDFGEKYIASIYDAPAERTDFQSYNQIKALQLEGKKRKEVNQKIIESISSLTPQDREYLVKSAYDPLDSRTITIRASAQALGDWASKSFPEDEDEIVFNFFQRLDKQPNADPDVVMQTVQKDYIRKNFPSTTQLPDVPNLVGNRNRIIGAYKKESKAKGKKVNQKPVSTAFNNLQINFEDL